AGPSVHCSNCIGKARVSGAAESCGLEAKSKPAATAQTAEASRFILDPLRQAPCPSDPRTTLQSVGVPPTLLPTLVMQVTDRIRLLHFYTRTDSGLVQMGNAPMIACAQGHVPK